MHSIHSYFSYCVCLLVVAEMRAALQTLENRVATLEKSPAGVPSAKVDNLELLNAYFLCKRHSPFPTETILNQI